MEDKNRIKASDIIPELRHTDGDAFLLMAGPGLSMQADISDSLFYN